MKWKIKAGKLLLDRQRSKGNDCSDCFSSPREIPISRLMIYQSVKRFFCYPQHCATRTFDFIMSTLFLPFPTLLFFSFPPVFEYLSLRNSHWTLNLIISQNENKSSRKRDESLTSYFRVLIFRFPLMCIIIFPLISGTSPLLPVGFHTGCWLIISKWRHHYHSKTWVMIKT